MREDYYAGLEDRYFLTYDQAKEQKFVIDFDAAPPAPTPNKMGVTVIDSVTLEDVVPYIDWVSTFVACSSCQRKLSSILLTRLASNRNRTLSSKLGSFEVATPTAVTPRSSTMRPLGRS